MKLLCHLGDEFSEDTVSSVNISNLKRQHCVFAKKKEAIHTLLSEPQE